MLAAGKSIRWGPAARAAVRRQLPSWRAGGHLRRAVQQAALAVARVVPPAVKRLLDAALAAGLLLLLAPVLLAAACVCRRHGPALRREICHGQDGRQFARLRLAVPDNRTGRLLLASGLAELPVLWNIVRGDMSWIGPRPHRADESPSTQALMRRNDRPGLVSLGWVRQRANIDYAGQNEADLEYVETCSLRGDVGIALRACWAALLGRRQAGASGPLNVLGIPLRNVAMEQAVDELAAVLDRRQEPQQICFVNADCVNLACRDAEYLQCLQGVGWNYADGMGLKLAARWQGHCVRQNVNGTDLFPRLLQRLQDRPRRLFLLGGQPGVADDAADWIRRNYPRVPVVGVRDGYFGETETGQVIADINGSGAELLLVAFGAPRQDLWIRRHLPRLQVTLAIGVGGLLDFYSGRKRRAPQWVREMGMEWAYRLWLEPRRLWKRYLVGNSLFLARVGADAARRRLSR